MATYYWVGGSGTWDSSTTTNWSLSSGGSGGAGVPTSSDNAVFDSNSGAGTVTIDAAGVECTDFTYTSSVGNLDFDGSGSFNGIRSNGVFEIAKFNSSAFESVKVRFYGTQIGSTGGANSYIGLLYIRNSCTLNSRVYARRIFVWSSFDLLSGDVYVNGCSQDASSPATNGRFRCIPQIGQNNQFLFNGDLSGVVVYIEAGNTNSDIEMNPPTIANVGELIINNTYTTYTFGSGVKTSSLTANAGVFYLQQDVYVYGSFLAGSSATLQASSSLVNLLKIPGSPNITRNVQMLATTVAVSGNFPGFLFNAGLDTINISGTKFGASSTGQVGAVTVSGTVNLSATEVKTKNFIINSGSSFDVSAVVNFSTSALLNSSVGFVQGACVINIDPALDSLGLGSFRSTISLNSINVLPGTVSVPLNCTVQNLNCTTGAGQGNIAITFASSIVLTITGTLTLQGASPSDMVMLSGSSFTISKASGTVNAQYTSLTNSTATGGATFYALIGNGNIDGGGNTGWIFQQQSSGSFFLFL